jgi:hypothetical protein
VLYSKTFKVTEPGARTPEARRSGADVAATSRKSPPTTNRSSAQRGHDTCGVWLANEPRPMAPSCLYLDRASATAQTLCGEFVPPLGP